jgi:phage I-like protein
MKHALPPLTVLAAALDLPDVAGAPEWIHILPCASGTIQTFDGRGPYVVTNAEQVIANSLADPRGIPIDVNHSINIAAPEGREAPARGWITAMEAREDGIWGKAEWTNEGQGLVADKAYRAISPVMILQADAKTLSRISVVSLVNKPNLRGLTALHQEQPMNWASIAKALGLAETATEEECLAAIAGLKKKETGEPAALQSALTEIGAALGVAGGDAVAILAAAKGAKTTDGAVVAMQAELVKVTGQLTSLQSEGAKSKATTFVDGEIAKGRVGVKPLREHYISMHMEDAGRVEKELGALPILGNSGQITAQPPTTGGEITSLNAEQRQVADALGITHEAMLATVKAEQSKETF